MFKIAICDDDANFCSQLEGILSNYARICAEKFELEVFYFGDALYQAFAKGADFDMIFLDIEMEGMNGVELGHRIREEFLDEVTQIVYVSSKQEYALALFENRPLHFLLKNLNPEDILKVLKKALKLKARQNLCFEFISNRTLCRIPHKEITYFESFNKKILIYGRTQNYTFYGKLPKVHSQLEGAGFIQIHKSYVINYTHIKEVHTNHVILASNLNLPISKTYKKSALEHMFKLRKG